jgi:hypothetical protein
MPVDLHQVEEGLLGLRKFLAADPALQCFVEPVGHVLDDLRRLIAGDHKIIEVEFSPDRSIPDEETAKQILELIAAVSAPFNVDMSEEPLLHPFAVLLANLHSAIIDVLWRDYEHLIPREIAP